MTESNLAVWWNNLPDKDRYYWLVDSGISEKTAMANLSTDWDGLSPRIRWMIKNYVAKSEDSVSKELRRLLR